MTIEANKLKIKHIYLFFGVFRENNDTSVENYMAYFDDTDFKDNIFGLGFSANNAPSDVWCLPEHYSFSCFLSFLQQQLCAVNIPCANSVHQL